MLGHVIIRLLIDATDEPDAIESVLNLMGRAIGKCRTQKHVREWLQDHAEIRFEPAPEAPHD